MMDKAKWNFLKDKLKGNQSDSDHWLELVQYASTWQVLPELILQILRKAVIAIPDSQKSSSSFTQIWLLYASQLRKLHPIESRRAYEHMVSNQIAVMSAFFYITWAELEYQEGNFSASLSVLKKGKEMNALPISILTEAITQLQTVGLNSFTSVLELPYMSLQSHKDVSKSLTTIASVSKKTVPEFLPLSKKLKLSSPPAALHPAGPCTPPKNAQSFPLSASHPASNVDMAFNSQSIQSSASANCFRNFPANILINEVQYALVGEVGRGGTAQVFRAFSPNWNMWAVKLVKFREPHSWALYLKEVELLEKFKKSFRIVHLHDFEIDQKQGLLKMVLEFGEIDLQHLLNRHQKQCGKCWQMIDLNTMRYYWQHMLEAVHEIHEAQVIHTDLKPANFLMVQGKLKLIDFGIADDLDDCTSVERDSGIGTPSYLSPEACDMNKCKVGRPADVWSLGIILYQLMYGITPFSNLSKVHKLLSIPDPKYRIDWPAVENRDLLDVAQSCLQRNPKLRPTIPTLLNHSFLFPT